MTEQAPDVYREWLGIADAQRPLNNYQLLRIKLFEDDAGKIRRNYRKMNEHVRKYASGKYAARSQELLNELARAMLCLTDERRKREYDAALGRQDRQGRKRLKLEERLLTDKVITQEQLEKARNYADAIGLELRDALIQQKVAAPDVVTQAYAEEMGVPYIELSEVQPDLSLVDRISAMLARQHSCVPVMIDDGQLLMASPNSLPVNVEEELRLRLGMPVRSILCTPTAINEFINIHYPQDKAKKELQQRGPQGLGSDPATPEGKAQEDRSKQRLLISVCAFAFTMIISQLLIPEFFPEYMNYNLYVSALVGLVGGAVTYVIMQVFKL